MPWLASATVGSSLTPLASRKASRRRRRVRERSSSRQVWRAMASSQVRADESPRNPRQRPKGSQEGLLGEVVAALLIDEGGAESPDRFVAGRG